MKKIWRFIAALILCEGAGAIGTIFTISAIPAWYSHLNKPVFSPPNWLFGPVWTILYALLAVCLFILWNKISQNKKAKTAVCLFLGSLFLNAIWTPIFFGLRNPIAGFVVIILMWLSINAMIFYFYKIDKTASLILISYWCWVTFASVLNLAIVILN